MNLKDTIVLTEMYKTGEIKYHLGNQLCGYVLNHGIKLMNTPNKSSRRTKVVS